MKAIQRSPSPEDRVLIAPAATGTGSRDDDRVCVHPVLCIRGRTYSPKPRVNVIQNTQNKAGAREAIRVYEHNATISMYIHNLHVGGAFECQSRELKPNIIRNSVWIKLPFVFSANIAPKAGWFCFSPFQTLDDLGVTLGIPDETAALSCAAVLSMELGQDTPSTIEPIDIGYEIVFGNGERIQECSINSLSADFVGALGPSTMGQISKYIAAAPHRLDVVTTAGRLR
jgi:hypothetical protein